MKKSLFVCCVVLTTLCCQAEKFPIIFCQAQLKYPIVSGPSLVCYYSNWVDTPLLISSSYPWKERTLGKEDFMYMRQIARDYGFAGFGFWRAMIRTKRRADFLVYAEKEPLDNFKMVPIISKGAENSPAGFSIRHDAPRLLNSPAVMEINGKKLFWTYNVRPNAALQKYQQGISKFGKNFLIVCTSAFVPEIRRFPLNKDGSLHPKAAAAVQTTVRSALDKFDGFAWSGMSTNGMLEKGERVYNQMCCYP